jgi:hypothetical protein
LKPVEPPTGGGAVVRDGAGWGRKGATCTLETDRRLEERRRDNAFRRDRARAEAAAREVLASGWPYPDDDVQEVIRMWPVGESARTNVRKDLNIAVHSDSIGLSRYKGEWYTTKIARNYPNFCRMLCRWGVAMAGLPSACAFTTISLNAFFDSPPHEDRGNL